MFKRVLVVSPHTDDGELACGGTISKLVENGVDVYYVALSICENAIPKGFKKDVLMYECKQALYKLGVPENNINFLRLPNMEFQRENRYIFHMLEQFYKEIKPDTVFIPSPYDNHQDHHVVYEESIRAFRRNCTIISYEEPWNIINNRTNLFISLDSKHIEKKLEALSCYKTQLVHNRDYFSEVYITSLAKSRGIQIASKYAEAFEVIKWVMI